MIFLFFLFAKCEYNTYTWKKRMFCYVNAQNVENSQFQLNPIEHSKVSMLMLMTIVPPPHPKAPAPAPGAY